MAWALVISLTEGAPLGGAGFTTASIDTTGADLIVVNIGDLDNTAGVTDSKGNTYTLAVNSSTALAYDRLHYRAVPTVGTGHTFTVTGTFDAVTVAAFSGAATSPLDQTSAAGNAAAASLQPGSITPSEDGCLVVSGMAFQEHTNAAGIDGGFTIVGQQFQVDSTHFGGGLAYLIQTTAAAANPTWNGGAAGTFTGTTIVSFKGGAAPPPPAAVMFPRPTQSPARLL